MQHPINIAIVGATGAVGRELLTILEQRHVPVASMRLFASQRSAGQQITFRGERLTIQPIGENAFDGVDAAFFSAGADVSTAHAPRAADAGAIVIDNSSAFRMDPHVPLVVPEVNPDALTTHVTRTSSATPPSVASVSNAPQPDAPGPRIVAVPNCTTIILCIAVAPLHRLRPIRRIVVSTYQAISGAGARALAELDEQTRAVANQQTPTARVLPHVAIHNVFSHNSPVGPDGYNGEETKVIQEARKILQTPDLTVVPTCIRVPVPRAHSESIHLTFDEPVDLEAARRALEQAPGIRLVDDPKRNRFPMPVEASGQDDVLVGRIRYDPDPPPPGSSPATGLNLFVCGDQLRTGAALTAVKILEHHPRFIS